MRPLVRLAGGTLALAIALSITGCATQATNQAMVVAKPAPSVKQYPYSASVATSGGAETSALGSTNIDNAELKTAIEKSIRDSKLFREVVDGKGGQYQLSVVVIQMSKPMLGLDFTVALEAGWTLVRASDNKVVLRQVFKSSHTAKLGDAFVGTKRLQLAVEGAARANIEQGLAAIAALDLPGGQS